MSPYTAIYKPAAAGHGILLSFGRSVDLVAELHHPAVELIDQSRAVLQLFRDRMLVRNIPLVLHFVFDACPEIHRDRTELNFYLHHIFAGRQVDGHFQDQMKAPVAVILRIFNVVLLLEQPDVILLCEAVPEPVNVVDVGAYGPDSRNILQIAFNVADSEIDSSSIELFKYAPRRLDG